MRTIGRKIVKIGIIAAQRVFKGLIRVLIRTIKIPYTAKSRTLFGKNYKIFRRLGFLDPRNFYITPSIITETGHKTFALLSFADIAYHLDFPIHIPIANPTLDIFCIHVSVFKPFPDNKRYNLPRFPVDFQDGNPRRIDAEIVQIPVFERNDADSFSPLIFAYRFEIRQNATAFRSCCGKRFFPSGIVEIGQIPTLDLSSGIVIFSFPIIVVQNGRRGPLHLSGRRKNFFPVHFHAKRRFRRGAELRQMNIPRHAAIVIREPVAENQTYRVFSFFQQRGNIVFIVNDHLIGIAYVRRENAFRYACSVDVQIVKTERCDPNFRIFNVFVSERKNPTHIRRRHIFIEIGIFFRRANKRIFKSHNSLLSLL